MTLPLTSVEHNREEPEADAKPSLTEGARCSLAFAAVRLRARPESGRNRRNLVCSDQYIETNCR